MTKTIGGSRLFHRLRQNRLALLGLALVVAFVLVAAAAPLLAPPPKWGNSCAKELGIGPEVRFFDPAQPYFWRALLAPPKGCYQLPRVSYGTKPLPPLQIVQTDGGPARPLLGVSNGFDLYYGLVWGTRTALKLGCWVVGCTFLIGLLLGSLAGYLGGWFDLVLMRLIDVLFAFPGIILVLVITSLLGPSLENVLLAFIIVGWAGYARLMRGEVLRVKNLEYVEGAKALGASSLRIVLRHVIPNVLTTILALVVLDLGSIPLAVAGLSFLGIGLPEGFADWGQLINFARMWLRGPVDQPFAYWYVTVFPALTIVLFGLGWNLLGDGLRDALDPRST